MKLLWWRRKQLPDAGEWWSSAQAEPSMADVMVAALQRHSEVRHSERLQLANGYLAGFISAKFGEPFNAECAALIDDSIARRGLPRGEWLGVLQGVRASVRTTGL